MNKLTAYFNRIKEKYELENKFISLKNFIQKNKVVVLTLSAIIILSILIITVLVFQNSKRDVLKINSTDSNPLSYVASNPVQTPTNTEDIPQWKTEALELSKKLYADNQIVNIDNCKRKFSNPNFKKFSFIFDGCKWGINQNLDIDRLNGGYFELHLNLINQNFSQQKAEMNLFAAWPMGWSGPNECYKQMDIYRIGNTGIFRDIYNSENKDKFYYSSNYVLPSYPNFYSVVEYSTFVYDMPSYISVNGISYPISYNTNGIKYCKHPGPTLSSITTPLEKNKQYIKNIYDSDQKEYFVIIQIETDSKDMNFVTQLDQIIETLTY